ncbi:MAG: choice-of-anchor Q domain-containing protein, partial [Lysobacterales bacterium]
MTYTVCPDGCDYTTPDAALSGGLIADGDTIDIANETYELGGTMLVQNSITILGNNSVIDANTIPGEPAIVVVAAASNVSMSNITIRNAQVDEGNGGALRMTGGVQVNLINVNFENNQAESGGAIYNNGSNLFVNVAVFSGNRATNGDGGAIFTDNLGISNLQRTIIDGNTASNAGGGVAVSGNSPLDPQVRSQIDLNRSTVSNNTAVTVALDQSNDTSNGTSTACGNGEAGTQGQTFLPTTEILTAFEFEVAPGGTPPAPGTLLQGRVRLGDQDGPVIATATTVWPVGQPTFLRYELDVPVSVTTGILHSIEIDTSGPSVFGIPTTIGSNPYTDGSIYYICDQLITPAPDDDYDFRTFGGPQGEGSGVHSSLGGHAGLVNTTVSGNVGDGVFATAGGLVSTWFNTIANNSGVGATATPEVLEPDFIEAGLVFLTASIVAENGGDDCNGDMVTSGYNLIGEDTNCVLGPEPNGTDIIGTGQEPEDPLLGPLQNNGGFTPTHAIDGNSPAFDAAGPDDPGLPC